LITAYKADKFDLTSDIYTFDTINPREETISSESLTLLLKVKASKSFFIVTNVDMIRDDYEASRM
jgi:hypothetical protein